MATSRYSFTSLLPGRQGIATSRVTPKIYSAVTRGSIPFSTAVLKKSQRLDHIAAEVYGSASLWWVIAAASGIGWGLQAPEGTIIRIPKDIGAVFRLLR